MTGLFLGIDIGGSKTGIAIGDGNGRILQSCKFKTEQDPFLALDMIIKRGKRMIADFHGIDAIGVSCGGPLDSVHGVILAPPHLPSWTSIPVTSILEDAFLVPSFLQNDANACALAEWQWGNGMGSDNMVFITCGTGFGAGLILNGKLYEGSSGMAGEIGHVRLSSKGPLCYGKRGCVESFCSGHGISLVHKSRTGLEMTAREICRAAIIGEAKAIETIDFVSRRMGEAIAIIVDLINPERIIIGSIYTRNESLFRDRVLRAVQRESLSFSMKACSILPSGLGESIGYSASLGVAKSFCEGGEK